MKARGFTLIELLAAMAILAVVSVMAVQALGGVFHQRAVLTRVDDRAAALVRTLSLLRQDLEAAVPLPATGALRDNVRSAIAIEARGMTLLRGGIAELPGVPGSGLAGVQWQLSDGVLSRGLIRDIVGAASGGAAPDRVPMLEGVTAITLTVLGEDAEERDERLLAPGYALTLETDAWGAVRLVVAW